MFLAPVVNMAGLGQSHSNLWQPQKQSPGMCVRREAGVELCWSLNRGIRCGTRHCCAAAVSDTMAMS